MFSGFVTKVEGNYIVIDTTLHVDKKVLQACPFQHQLEVGVKVSYLAYKAPDSESIKVIKLEALLNEVWGEKQKEKAQEEEVRIFFRKIPISFYDLLLFLYLLYLLYLRLYFDGSSSFFYL